MRCNTCGYHERTKANRAWYKWKKNTLRVRDEKTHQKMSSTTWTCPRCRRD